MRRPSDQLRGNGNGAILIAAMGSVWMVVALHHHLLPLALTLLFPLLLVTLGVKLLRAGQGLRELEQPQTAAEVAAERALQKRFTWIFAAEGIAIFLAVNVLANLGMSVFLMPTIGVIVGLHFLPLAGLYGRSVFYWSGAAQILLCIAFAVTLRANANLLNMVTGAAMGAILWSTMLAVVIQSLRSLPANRALTTNSDVDPLREQPR